MLLEMLTDKENVKIVKKFMRFIDKQTKRANSIDLIIERN